MCRFTALHLGCEVPCGLGVRTGCGERGGEDGVTGMSTAKFLPYEVSFLLYILPRQIAHTAIQTYHTPLAGGKYIIKEDAKIGAIVGDRRQELFGGIFLYHL